MSDLWRQIVTAITLFARALGMIFGSLFSFINNLIDFSVFFTSTIIPILPDFVVVFALAGVFTTVSLLILGRNT